jgi:glucosamine--fructose-6-phosphate aminotransferase (isomerizing)
LSDDNYQEGKGAGMCGIVGYVGEREASGILLEGLRSLEYRGYDSAGIAVLNGGAMELRRSNGKLSTLESLLKTNPAHGFMGLGHTRWATHGKPSESNAHPHACCNDKIFVVHNGIIENHDELRRELIKKGHLFKSQTDTEVLAHLIEDSYEDDILAAVKAVLPRVEGSYALGVAFEGDRGRLIAARRDSPLVLGVGENEMFLASDISALLHFTRKAVFLEDGDVADITRGRVSITDAHGKAATREPQMIFWDAKMAEKNGYKHYMLKEINEQTRTVQNACRARISESDGRVRLEDSLSVEAARAIQRVCLMGCGTSYHAGLVARYWLEEVAKIPCEVEVASEFRYMRSVKPANTLVVAITQSGETADTLAALRAARLRGFQTLAVCNVVGSSAARAAANALYTHCGPEISVASTKAFTGQLTTLFLFALYLAQCRCAVRESESTPLLRELIRLPRLIQSILDRSEAVEEVARRHCRARGFLFLGRHLNYPVALEGALKLKEISYIHAEGYPAGELKHGPLALVDDAMPVVVIASQSSVRGKVISNIQEVRARGGKVIAIANEGDEEVAANADFILPVPRTHEYLAPLLSITPLQLLAYHIADINGCDVDQPRNLAKSVTVE